MLVEWNNSDMLPSGDDSGHHYATPPVVGLVAVVLEGLLMVLILLGNGLVLAVYLRSPSLHTVSNFYIIQLAVADICVGALMPMHIVMYLHPRWMTKYLHLCLFRYTSMLLFQSASIASLVALTWDRFNAVVRPLHYHENVTGRGYVRGVVAVWLFPLTLGFLLPMFWHIVSTETTKGCFVGRFFRLRCSARNPSAPRPLLSGARRKHPAPPNDLRQGPELRNRQ